MKTLIITSQNPVKEQAALSGFQKMFPGEEFRVEQLSVSSGVDDQPASDIETYQGAINRAMAARSIFPQADFCVGIEGGVETRTYPGTPEAEMAAFAWVVICSSTRVGKGRTGTFFLPPEIRKLVQAGKELGEADDIVFYRSNSKQDNGAVGILTGNVIDRKQLYEQAVILALIPFRNDGLYDNDE